MGPVRVLILAVALTAAVGAALVVRSMAKGQAPAPAADSATAPAVERLMTEVLVAKRDLEPGTTLAEADMAWQSWPQESLNEQFITKTSGVRASDSAVVAAAAGAAEKAKDAVVGPQGPMAELIGAVVRERIVAGEPMSPRKVVRAGSAGLMAITLGQGMRAMAVPLSAESAAGGFILPGDHVDVVQSRELDSGDTKRAVSMTIMRNVKVLAIDQAIGAKDVTLVGATATLEVNPSQAEVLVLAKSQGELTLVLRSYADTDGPAETVQSATDDGFQAAVVRVYRNAEPTDVTVAR